MIEFSWSTKESPTHDLLVQTDEDEMAYVSDDEVGDAAQELLRTHQFDGLGIKPSWMAYEVTYRARDIAPDVDFNWDFEVRESDDGAGATIVVLREI